MALEVPYGGKRRAPKAKKSPAKKSPSKKSPASDVPKRQRRASVAKQLEQEAVEAEAVEDVDDEVEVQEVPLSQPQASKRRLSTVPTAARTSMAPQSKRAKVAGEGEGSGEDGEDSDAAVAGRKKELKAMPANDLKALVQSKGLEAGTKADNVEAILQHEARARAAEAKKQEDLRGIEQSKRQELSAMAAPDLRSLCEQKGLKLGGIKEEKVERLVAKAREDGEFSDAYASMTREARRSELMSMDKEAVLIECAKLGVDPLVKEIMVERILVRESTAR